MTLVITTGDRLLVNESSPIPEAADRMFELTIYMLEGSGDPRCRLTLGLCRTIQVGVTEESDRYEISFTSVTLRLLWQWAAKQVPFLCGKMELNERQTAQVTETLSRLYDRFYNLSVEKHRAQMELDSLRRILQAEGSTPTPTQPR